MRLHEYVAVTARDVTLPYVNDQGTIMTVEDYERIKDGKLPKGELVPDSRTWHFFEDGIFVVPPLGKDGEYARRTLAACICREVKRAWIVVCARVDSRWWFEVAPRANAIIFVRGRLRDDVTNEALSQPRVILSFDRETCKKPPLSPLVLFDSISSGQILRMREQKKAGGEDGFCKAF